MEANQEAQSAQNADMRERRLKALRLSRVDMLGATSNYQLAIWHARRDGIGVSEIARALGISRTAVYKQLGKKEGR